MLSVNQLKSPIFSILAAKQEYPILFYVVQIFLNQFSNNLKCDTGIMEIFLQKIIYGIVTIECIMLLFQLNNAFLHRKNISYFKFSFLIILFICYNFAGIFFPDNKLSISIFSQMIIGNLTGIFALGYYYYYITKELNIILFERISFNCFLSSLSISFIFIFSLSFFVTENLEISEKIFLLIPICVSLYLLYNLSLKLVDKLKVLRRKKSPYGIMLISAYCGFLCIALLPVFIILDVPKNINFLLVNFAFFIIYSANYNNRLYQTKLEYFFLQKMGYKNELFSGSKTKILIEFKNFGLTSRELDVAFLIAKGKKYNEIAQEIFISPKTVSKHASNIYKKTNTINKKEFYSKFYNNGY